MARSSPEARRRYREAHREEIAAYQREWNARNRDHVAEYSRRRKASLTDEQKFVYDSNKRAKQYGCADRLKVGTVASGPCAYCGRTEPPVGWDHVIPLSRGGANTIENIVPCCKPCNNLKTFRTPEEWRDEEAAEARRERKRAYVRQWHRDHYAELQVKRKAKRDLVGHW